MLWRFPGRFSLNFDATSVTFLDHHLNNTYFEKHWLQNQFEVPPDPSLGLWHHAHASLGELKGDHWNNDWWKIFQLTKVMCSPSLHYSFCRTGVGHNDLFVAVCHAPWRGLMRETPPLAEQKEWEPFNRWCLHSCAHFIFNWMSVFAIMSTFPVLQCCCWRRVVLLAIRVGIA